MYFDFYNTLFFRILEYECLCMDKNIQCVAFKENFITKTDLSPNTIICIMRVSV